MAPENEKEKTKEKFIKEFNEHLDSSVLPARFAKEYHIVNCIKETPDRSVYVIADKEERLFILKTGKEKRAETLWQEFHLNEQLKNVPDLAIPEALSCVETDDGCYLMNTYIKGLNLVQYQEKYAPLTEADVVSLMFKMCRVIETLHSQDPPIIHRDIKPENFVLEEGTGVLYLVDLDTGRQYYPKKKRDTMFVGTFSQAAPEQFGFSQSDIRTDIYGLGKSMVYLLTGDAAAENLQNYGISPAFRKIVEKSTEFDPDKRYSGVKQMIRDLKRYQMRRVTLPSYRLAACCSLLFLTVGLATGYAAGDHYGMDGARKEQPEAVAADGMQEDQPQAEGTDTVQEEQPEAVAADGMQEDQPQADGTDAAQEGQPQTDGTQTDGQDASGEQKQSLRDQAGAYRFDVTSYKEYCDALILDYYGGDEDAMAADCEKFVEAVSSDPEVSRIPGEDYDKLDAGNDPEFWNMDMLNTIRARLAYKDRLLCRKLGDYSQYKHYFMAAFGFYLSDPEGQSFLARYARGEENIFEDDYTLYSWIVSDCLCCLTDAFDRQEELSKKK